MHKIVLIFFLLLFFSCNNNENEPLQQTSAPKVVEAKGYVVPTDSMGTPPVFAFDESKLTKIPAGRPTVVTAYTNVHFAGIPEVVLAGNPRICTPGQDSFLLPKTIPTIGSPFVAGIPEVVIAKDAYVKDQNPENFSSFSKLQGLKHNIIRCLLQDQSGNIWFGTYGGGVSKYDGKSFTHFTELEGLCNNFVLSMVEDKKGNLWFGTNGGVSKYDGKSFIRFTEKEGLSNNTVLSMLEDKSGNLWFGTNGGGLSKYDGKSFIHFTEKEGLGNNTVYSILEDKNGNLWFGTWGGGAIKYNGKFFTHFTEKEGLIDNTVLSMLEDKSGNLWFGTFGGGVSEYDGKSFKHFTGKEGLSSNSVYSMLEDNSGNLWFGTYGDGIVKYDGTSFTHFREKEGLGNIDVYSILEDKSGNLWFGTSGGGISKYGGKSFTHFTEKEGLTNNTVYSMLEDKSGNLWFGTDGGVSKYDGMSFTQFTEKEGLKYNSVLSILEDKSGNLWFGSWGGGVSKYDGISFTHFTKKDGMINNPVRSILEDKSGNLWFGTYGGGVSKYDGKSFTQFTEKEGLCDNSVYSMLQDKSGNLWFGTSGGGVSKYDGKSFTSFTEKEGLSNNIVRTMLEDKSGNLWFGTFGGGVSMYDGKFFTHFTEKQGLCNNYVYSILEDKGGNLWFGTRSGLSKLSHENREKLIFFSNSVNASGEAEEKCYFKNYTYEDGFLGFGVNGGKTICEDRNGAIWVATNDRLTVYHPEGEVPDTVAPNIHLTSIALFNENIAWTNLEKKKDSTLTLGNGVCVGDFDFDGITKWYGLPENLSLAHNNNYLTFSFIGITQKQSKKVKYQYKLEGNDENWSAVTSKNDVAYGNLDFGTYTFRVKAMNSEGYWSKPLSYTFTIRPPWWKTIWFRTTAICSLLCMVYVVFRWRTKALRDRQRALEKTVEERTEELVQKNIVVEQQKHLVEEKHRAITDSIIYAERIQRSLLASKKLLDENLKDYFILYKPKDVVSGDFYWATKLSNNNFVLVNADSTGHGVPGAIMSILNISCLEKAVEVEKLISPSEILNHTRIKIIETLKKDGSSEGGKDGMDGSLLSFDFKNNILNCASANNPIWVIRNKELIEIKGNRFPIGKHEKDNEPFTLHTLNLQQGDVVYTLTDGFPDQFGGVNGKKFKYKQLQELLLSVAFESMEIQKQKLSNVFDNWKGNLEQVDDVTIVGVRV